MQSSATATFLQGTQFIQKEKKKCKNISKIIWCHMYFCQPKSPTIPDRLTTKSVLAPALAEESSFIFKSPSLEQN